MLLIRHSICEGDLSLDPGITSAGFELIRNKANKIIKRNIRLILHSPKRRAVETASLFYDLTKANIMLCVDELREIHPFVLSDNKSTVHPDYFRAESVILNHIMPNLNDSRVIIVSHRNLLNFVLRYIGYCKSIDLFRNPCTIIDINEDIVGGGHGKTKRSIIPFF